MKLQRLIAPISTLAVVVYLLLIWPQAARTNDLTVCPAGPPACEYTSIQAAVDAASHGDVIKIAAGVYTHVLTRSGSAQVVYVNKSITLRGGYSVPFIAPPDPQAHPAILDAQGRGRGLYITGQINPTIEGLHITNGLAPAGGGIYIISATAVLSGNYIYNNTAYRGGGVYLKASTSALIANTVSANIASYGGGLYLEHAGGSVLSRNVLQANTASFSGGGLMLSAGAAALDHNTIASNSAGYGGGLHLAHSTAALEGDLILRNSAEAGGGVYLASSQPLFSNVVVANNYASKQGSGVYAWEAAPHLQQVTIARNTGGDSSGVYATGASVIELTNVILSEQAIGLKVTPNNTATIDGVLWHNVPVTLSRPATASVTVQNQHVGEARFMADGYHLIEGSAAIDNGSNSGVTSDIDGEARPHNGGYDLGADEFHPTPQLALIQSASADPVQAGQRLVYTLRITNTGNTGLHATLTDTLPARATPGGVLTWTIVLTQPGAGWTHQVAVTVAIGYSGTLTNRVRASTIEGATAAHTLTTRARVTPSMVIYKTVTPPIAQAGEWLTYTIHTINTGNIDLHATVTDTLPAQTTPGGVLTWTPLITAPGGTWTRQIVVQAQWGYSGTLVNTVQATSAEGAMGVYTTASSVRVTPALSVTKRISPAEVRAGERLTCTISVTNTGNIDLHAAITDILPAQAHTTQPLTWATVITAPGGVWTQQVIATMTQGYAGQLTNIVQVATQEGVSGSCAATWTARAPLLKISKQAAPLPARSGSPLVYTLYVTNTGNVTLHAAITDTLPARVTPGGVRTWSAVLAPGASWTQAVSVTIEPGYAGPLVNVARVSTAEGATGIYTHTTTVKRYIYLPIVFKQWTPPPEPTLTLYLHGQDAAPRHFLSPTMQEGNYVGIEFNTATEWQMPLTQALKGSTYAYAIYAGSIYPDRGGGVVCDVEILLRRGGADTLLVSWPQAFTTFDSYQAVLFSGQRVGADPNAQAGDVLILRIRPHNGTVRVWTGVQNENGGYSNIQVPAP